MAFSDVDAEIDDLGDEAKLISSGEEPEERTSRKRQVSVRHTADLKVFILYRLQLTSAARLQATVLILIISLKQFHFLLQAKESSREGFAHQGRHTT